MGTSIHYGHPTGHIKYQAVSLGKPFICSWTPEQPQPQPQRCNGAFLPSLTYSAALSRIWACQGRPSVWPLWQRKRSLKLKGTKAKGKDILVG